MKLYIFLCIHDHLWRLFFSLILLRHFSWFVSDLYLKGSIRTFFLLMKLQRMTIVVFTTSISAFLYNILALVAEVSMKFSQFSFPNAIRILTTNLQIIKIVMLCPFIENGCEIVTTTRTSLLIGINTTFNTNLIGNNITLRNKIYREKSIPMTVLWYQALSIQWSWLIVLCLIISLLLWLSNLLTF